MLEIQLQLDQHNCSSGCHLLRTYYVLSIALSWRYIYHRHTHTPKHTLKHIYSFNPQNNPIIIITI